MCVNIQIPITLYSKKGKIQVEKSEKKTTALCLVRVQFVQLLCKMMWYGILCVGCLSEVNQSLR